MLQKPSKIRATAGHGNSGWLSRGGGWPAVWRPPYRRALNALVHLRRHDTLARDAGRPGRTRGPTTARIIRVCGQQGVPAWPDRAGQGAGPRSPRLKRPPGGDPPHTPQTVDRALAQDRAPRRTRHGTARSPPLVSPDRTTVITNAVPTLQRHNAEQGSSQER